MMKMSKKLLSLLLCAIMVLGSVAIGGGEFAEVLDAFNIKASAASVDDLSYKISNNCVSITDCNTSASGSLSIPSTIKGYPVTSIGIDAFEFCSQLTSITIPDSVTSIGFEAFYYCLRLTSITIPDSVTSIGKDAFLFCDGLTSITVADDNPNYSNDEYGVLFNKDKTEIIKYPVGNERTSYSIPNSVTSIGSSAFRFCKNFTSVTIPDSVTEIGEYAFYCSTGLTSVSIGSSVTSIGFDAFGECTDLANVTIGNSVTSIGSSAFYNCTSLTSVTIPDSVTSIGSSAFSGCTGLTSITIPDSVTSIGGRAFYNCTGLTSISFPDKLTSMDESVCSNCRNLVSAKLSKKFPSIPKNTFSGCSALATVYIPQRVSVIYADAFKNCSSLTDVYYEGTAKSDVDLDNSNDWLLSAKWHCNAAIPSDINISVSSISIKSNPTKTTYTEGETLDTSGLKLTAKYSDGSTKEITSGFTCTPKTLSTVGTQKITVTFGGKTATFNVTVKADDKELRQAISNAVAELEEAKKNAVSDEAKTVINNAIASINNASSVSDVASKKNAAMTSANNADKALADAKAKAISELEEAKRNAKTDAERNEIDEKINIVNNATNLNTINAATNTFDKVNIKAADAKEIDYRSIVTIKATAENVPDGYKLAIYLGSQKVSEGDSKSVTYTYGELKSDLNYSVKVIDSNGKVQKDSSGKELSKDGGKITCKAGFFQKLIAFFRGLFGSLPKIEVKP